MIILLSQTLESQTAYTVQCVINTPEQNAFIEGLHQRRALFQKDHPQEIRYRLADIAKRHPELYGQETGDQWEQGNYTTSILQAAEDGSLQSKFIHCFETMYEQLFPYVIDQLPTDQTIVLTYPAVGYKPQGIDHFIGWAVDPQNYGIEHMEEHERIEKEAALSLSDVHNNWMRENQQQYDKFFDLASIDDVIHYIRGL
jgi:hypothetical protein